MAANVRKVATIKINSETIRKRPNKEKSFYRRMKHQERETERKSKGEI